MSPATPTQPPAGAAGRSALDVALVSGLLVQLNILRKNTKIYPDGHPALVASGGRAARLLREFHTRTDTFALTISRDTLQVGQYQMPRNNPIVAEFATHLHNQSVYAFSLKRGITDSELAQVIRLLGSDAAALPPGSSLPEAVIQASRGLAEVRLLEWGEAEFVDVAELDLAEPTRPEEAAGRSWESFIRRLLHRGDDALLGGEEGIALSTLGAERLAKLVDRLEDPRKGAADHGILADYVREGTAEETGQQRLLRLANSLEPGFRAELTRVPRLFTTRPSEATERLLEEKDAVLALGVLERLNATGPPIDPRLVSLLDGLADGRRHTPAWRPPLERPSQEREYSEHLQALLSARGFPPPPPTADAEAALRKLESDLQFRIGGEPGIAQNPLAALPALATPEHYATTLLDLLAGTTDPRVAERRARLLAGLIADHAQAGHWGIVLTLWRGLGALEAAAAPPFPELPELCRQAKTQTWNPEDHPRLATAILSYGLDKADFLADILRVTGRTQGQQIVDTYAQEGRESALAALFPLIVELKEQTMPHVLRLLDDKRPAVVCRMLQLLQQFADPTPLRKIEGLVARSDRTVKLEALRTAALLGSPKAPAFLVQLIQSPDPALSVGAIAIARLAPQAGVIRALREVLTAPRWFRRSYDLDRKVEAARSLLGMGKSELFADVYRAISRRPFFHLRDFLRLRLEVFRALARADLPGLGDFIRLGRSLRDAEIASLCRELERRQRAQTAAPRKGAVA